MDIAPVVVMVIEGVKVVTDSKCIDLPFSLQNHDFCGDLRVLHIQGYDIILGVDWLRRHSPMEINWIGKWVSFQKDGKLVKLQVQEEVSAIHFCEGVDVEKELKGGHAVMMAHVMLIQDVSVGKKNPLN
jgi:Retroviral aspartyl protease